jgi:glycosyltransferase involved in cell wall biosynthesis
MVFYGNTFEGGFWSALFGCLFSKRSLFRVRLSPHLFPHPIIDFYIFLLNKKLIFNSFFVEQEFKRRFPFLARVKSGLTVYNYMGGVSDYAKSDYGLGEVLTFAVVGRFEPIKNQAVVPIVAKYMKERGFSGFKILMIGHDDLRDEGAYRKEVASAIAALEVADVCEIVQDRATPAEVYSGVDVVLTLSRCEALPRVICESGLFGIRNIAVNAAGNKELIEGDPGGVPITDFEPRAVAEACIGVLQNKADLPILGQKSQAYYQALFSVDNTVKVELKLIETLF